MVDQENVAPVSGSDDARAGGERAEVQRDEAARKAENTLSQRQSAKGEAETRSHELAMEYLRLGGRRRAAMDDNITETRKWEPDPPEAEAFWQSNVAPLPEAERKQVEDHLPSINAE